MMNGCTFCSLYETSECNCLSGYNIKNVQNPPIMVVSDYVRQRYTHGYFTGAVTRDIDYVLKSTKIKPEDVFFTGLVRCAPPVKNKQQRNPSKEEVEKCSVYLEEEIYRVKPKVIIACGVIAFEYFFPKQSLSEEYCQIKWSEAHQTFVIGTYHPEIMVTSPEYDLVIQKAFQQARDFLDNKVVKPETNYVNITTLEDLQTVVNRVQEIDLLSFDLETSSKVPYKAKILSIGLSWKVGTGVAIPLYIKDEEAIAELRKDVTDKQLIKEIEKRIEVNPPLKSFWGKDHAFVVEQIKKILLSPAQKGGHNSFFDCSVLHFNGFSIKNYLFDTMIMMHLLDEERPKDLDYASWTLTDKGGYKMVKNKYLTTSDTCWAHIPTDILLHYNAGDADVTLEIYHKLRAAINLQGKAHLLDKICMPLQKRLLKASWRGMQIDKPYVLKIQKEMSEAIKGYMDDIQKTVSAYYPDKKVIVINDGDEKPSKSKIADDEVYFNLNSIKDLKELFIDKMQLKITQTTKKGNISLGESTLNFLAKKHDIADKIVQYRKKNKLKSTYVDGIFDQVDDNFVAHSTYRVDGTVTGRLASKNPNCFDKHTEILTEQGFKLFKDLTPNDKVAQWDNGEITFVTPTHYFEHDYKGPLVSIDDEGISLRVTPDHRCLIKAEQTGRYHVVPAEDYPLDFAYQLNAGKYTKGTLSLTSDEIVIICATQAKGQYLSDGSIVYQNLSIGEYDRLAAAFANKMVRIHKIDFDTFCIDKNYAIVEWIKYFLPERQFTYHLMNMTAKSRAIFCKEILFGGGTSPIFRSSFEQDANVVQSLFVLNNMRTHSWNSTNVEYCVYIDKQKNKTSTITCDKSSIYYNDKVYCVEVPSSFVVVRRSGNVCITGNCQNIPRDATIKRMFVARPGYKLAEIDMSQHELRVLAGLSNDPVMNKIYAEGGDIHMETAVSIFKLPANQISKEQRTIAKTVNFGIGYGMEFKTLMQNLADAGITVSKTQAQKYIQAWKDKYKIAWSYLQANVYKYQNHLVLRTPSGRERHAYRMFLDKYLREAQLREGQNFEIQSYASDLVYEIIIDLVDEIEKIGAFFINTVHDSIIIEYPEDKTEELAKICKRVMWRSIPALHGHMIKSDMAVSTAWGDKKDYDMEKLCFA